MIDLSTTPPGKNGPRAFPGRLWLQKLDADEAQGQLGFLLHNGWFPMDNPMKIR
jgi:hypothetical protein